METFISNISLVILTFNLVVVKSHRNTMFQLFSSFLLNWHVISPIFFFLPYRYLKKNKSRQVCKLEFKFYRFECFTEIVQC